MFTTEHAAWAASILLWLELDQIADRTAPGGEE
jgi:hypothetical protein